MKILQPLKIMFWCCLCLLVGMQVATAQEIQVSGTVRGPNNSPLPGVTVQVKGTENGTTTNSNGHYMVAAPENGTLIFRFLSYKTIEVAIERNHSIEVTMEPSSQNLNELVVTALGIKRKKVALGYSEQEIKGASLVKAPAPNVIASLSGKVSGLVITPSTNLFANPGIYLRGVHPLIVVDGVPINSDSWNLSPNDIQTITVLKGPTASALYGSQGQNGAILITTKSGTTNKRGVSVEVNSSTQFQTGFLAIPKVQQEYGPGEDFQYAFVDGKGGGINDADYDIWGPRFEGQLITQWNSPTDPTTGKLVPLPWLDRGKGKNLQNFLQTGLLTTNNVAVAGNNEKGNYRLSVTQLYQRGLIPNQWVGGTNTNFSGKLNFNEKFTIETDINYDKQYTPSYPTLSYSPVSPIYAMDIWAGQDYNIKDLRDYWLPGKVGTQQKWVEYYQYSNPWFTTYQQLKAYYKDDIYGHIKLNYQFDDHWNVFLRTAVSTYYLNQSQRYPISTTMYEGDGAYAHNGGFNESFENFWDNNTDFLLTYKNQVTHSLSLDASVGGNLRTVKDVYEYSHTNGGLLVPQLWTVQNSVLPTGATTTQNLRQVASIYAYANLDFKDYLFLSLTGRRDQSSTLPSAHNAYFYPSASLSAVLSQMINLPKFISFWKLRAAFARVGGDFTTQNGLSTYSLYPTYSTSTRWNGNVSEYFDNSTIYNLDIKPSFSTSYEAGTNIQFLNDRIGMDVSVFKTFDGPSIFNLPVSDASGFDSRQVNGLVTDRRGVEVTLNLRPVQIPNGLTWNVIINWSTYQKYLDKIYGDIKTYNHIKIGQRMDQIWMTTFESTPDGKMIFAQNGLPIRNTFPSMVGYSNDKWAASMENSFSYRSLSLSFQFEGRYGGQLVNYLDQKMWQAGTITASANQYRYDDWQNRNDPNYKGTFIGNGVVVTGGSVQYDGNGNIISDTRKYAPNTTPVIWQSYATRYYGNAIANLHNKNFLKLKEIILTYNIPERLLSRQHLLNRASVSFIGRNMLYWASKGVQDIDVEQWISSSTDLETPSVRSFGVNVDLVF